MSHQYVQASSGSPPPPSRRSANYHPSIWGDQFLSYASIDFLKTDADIEEPFQQLKKEVKKMVVAAIDEPHQHLDLIDDIQQLGVSYHFEPELDVALQHLNDIFQEFCDSKNDDDLHIISLCFRLLRQHGHNVSSDVFRKFKDKNEKFKDYLIKDTRGMLSLYEATHLRVYGEDILEEALAFAIAHLENYLKSHSSNSPLASQVVRALKLPIHKGLNRLEASHYISIYQEHESHNEVLLNFSKLDFNQLQKMYQGELSHITRPKQKYKSGKSKKLVLFSVHANYI